MLSLNEWKCTSDKYGVIIIIVKTENTESFCYFCINENGNVLLLLGFPFFMWWWCASLAKIMLQRRVYDSQNSYFLSVYLNKHKISFILNLFLKFILFYRLSINEPSFIFSDFSLFFSLFFREFTHSSKVTFYTKL